MKTVENNKANNGGWRYADERLQIISVKILNYSRSAAMTRSRVMK